MIIVTAADSIYFTGLLNLVGSIHYWSEHTQVHIYDIGLTDRQREEVARWNNTTLIKNFLLGDLPCHCMKLKLYAWKPAVLQHAIQNNTSILWIDAGSDLRASPIEIFSILEKQGYFFVQGQDCDMTEKSVDATYNALHANRQNFAGRPHYAGGLQGYIQGSSAHEQILKPLFKYAMDKSIIAPQGSSFNNHRYDQTLLSILIYQSGIQVEEHTRLLAAGRKEVNEDPELASKKVVYTARNSSIDYVFQVRSTDNSMCYQRNTTGSQIQQ